MNIKKLCRSAVLALTLSTFIGCGSATNNDQGVAFTFLGFFSDSTGTTGLSGASIGYSDATSEPGGFAPESLSVLAFLGVTNNLSGQYIRLQRAYISYTIPGAAVNPPSTSQAVAGILIPANNTVGSSLPPSILATGKTTIYAQVAVLPPQIRSWLSLQRESLPEAPFDIEANVFVHGVTSAGSAIETNEGGLRIRILPDDVIAPTSPDDSESTSEDVNAIDEEVTDDSELL